MVIIIPKLLYVTIIYLLIFIILCRTKYINIRKLDKRYKNFNLFPFYNLITLLKNINLLLFQRLA